MFMGVRISWVMLARDSFFFSAASTALCLAATSASKASDKCSASLARSSAMWALSSRVCPTT